MSNTAATNDEVRYNYPFAHVAQENEVRIKPKFSLQSAINTTAGTVLEVAGPSPTGFFFLQGITFPRRPFITNLNYKGVAMKEYQELYMPYIEKKLDICKTILKPESVGVCLSAYLNLGAKEPHRSDDEKAWKELWRQLAEEDKKLIADPKAVPTVGLRYIFLSRAIDFLEKDGLALVEGLREPELKYALALGFSLRAAVKPYKDNEQTVYYPSVVLQKSPAEAK